MHWFPVGVALTVVAREHMPSKAHEAQNSQNTRRGGRKGNLDGTLCGESRQRETVEQRLGAKLDDMGRAQLSQRR